MAAARSSAARKTTKKARASSRASGHKPDSFALFPDDILFALGEALAGLGLDATLAALGRTSTAAYDLLSPVLHRRVTLSARGVSLFFDVGTDLSQMRGVSTYDRFHIMYDRFHTIDAAVAHARQTVTYYRPRSMWLRCAKHAALVRTLVFRDFPGIERGARAFWSTQHVPYGPGGLDMPRSTAIA
ncbi:hypothetical protein Q5752_000480 [Cryptotrichosporon argae]